jgi:hypothetical protein
VDDEDIRIETVFFAEATLEKLWKKHQLEQWEVEEAWEDSRADPRWDTDPRHGTRVIVRGWTKAGELFVSLVPIDAESGLWMCVTAFEVTEEA